MEAFGIYSLKGAVLLFMFWGIYAMCLRKETFYRFNRFFLLVGLFAAALLPLVTIRYVVEVNTSAIPIRLITETVETGASAANQNNASAFVSLCKGWLPVIYLSVLCILLLIRTIGISRLFSVIRKNNGKQNAGYRLIESSDFDGAFSFFRFVFIPENIHHTEKQIILKHEEAHISQHHWFDLLLTNALSLIWWFNPVVRLYEKAIRNNHEYLADQTVLTDCQPTDYQQTLINQWFKTPVFPMAHSFSYANRLKRIHMMKKNISNPLKQFFALLALPGICLFLWSFAEPEYVAKNNSRSSEKDISMHNGEFEVVIKNGILSVNEMEKLPLIVLDEEISNQPLDEINTENFQSMTTLTTTDATEKYGTSGKNGAIEITTKQDDQMLIQVETTHNTKVEDPPVFTKTTEHQRDTTWDVTHIKGKFTKIDVSNQNPDVLVIIDGVKKEDGLNTLNPNDIESLSVLKDHRAIEQYGEEGKNGAILVTTKKSILPDAIKTSLDEKPDFENNSEVKVVGSGPLSYLKNETLDLRPLKKPFSGNDALCIVDGKKIGSLSNLRDINEEEIASISVLKDFVAMKMYGNDAKDGVILVTTKRGRAAAMEEFGYEIKGSVTDEAGIPIENARIIVDANNIYTDKNGTFAMRVIPGDYLTIMAEGYKMQNLWVEEDNTQTSFSIIMIKKE